MEDMFFSGNAEDNTPQVNHFLENAEYPDVPEFSKKELLKMEMDSTGMYISGHPLTNTSRKWKGRPHTSSLTSAMMKMATRPTSKMENRSVSRASSRRSVT